ncbi:MAG: E3 ubiquitin ligase family protein, partial [Dehalococcoidia bacterium]|nr:E3 ubiquitin ligase family protein [Dehalococcoidia bacterium]
YVAETRTHEGHGHSRDYLQASSATGALLESILGALDDDYDEVLGYRITESLIRVGQPVYVLGTAQRSGEVAALGKGDGPFVISHKMEVELSRKIKRSSALQYALAAILVLGGIAAMIYSAFM